jgi:hypothetical protein
MEEMMYSIRRYGRGDLCFADADLHGGDDGVLKVLS